MITIDKLCYHSKLRYCNAAEKFAFSVLTILFCVVSRSAVIAGIVLLTTGILTVWKGGIPFLRYLNAERKSPSWVPTAPESLPFSCAVTESTVQPREEFSWMENRSSTPGRDF